ncbi:MAG: FIST C-terminal domain-containing protein [Clostridiales bacterium]|jgi:hypothetical protein|nr:FIST C-terminal domain-containing protein [Clostridiales bacterium]
MVRSINLCTYEIDIPELAVEEIRSQLSGFQLGTNTAGIVMCDPEFLQSGVYAAICKELPFPIAGTTTMNQAVNMRDTTEVGILMLTILVLTSDDVSFSVGLSEKISPTTDSDVTSSLKKPYAEAAAVLNGKPELIFIFAPLFDEVAGDLFVDAFGEVAPNVPVFGSLAVSDRIEFDNCQTLFCGQSYFDKIAFIIVSGNVSPKFLFTVVKSDNKLPHSGKITKSKGHVIMEINGMNAAEYFTNIGIVRDGKLDAGMQFVAFVTEMESRPDNDGVPIVRALVYIDENGYGVCRGNMEANTIFTVTNPLKEDVLESTSALMDRILKEQYNTAIIFSCIIRRIVLGTDFLAEAELIAEKLKNTDNIFFSYSGGEICPSSLKNGNVTNRFHNYSAVACLL